MSWVIHIEGHGDSGQDPEDAKAEHEAVLAAAQTLGSELNSLNAYSGRFTSTVIGDHNLLGETADPDAPPVT